MPVCQFAESIQNQFKIILHYKSVYVKITKQLFQIKGALLMKLIKFKDCSVKERKLIKAAIEARDHAYAPYSNFKVGAAGLSSNGNIFYGCNIESADYTLTTHAEMQAVNCMVYSGEIPLTAIAVVLKCDQGYPTPCGLCRQKLREFSLPNAVVLSVNIDDKKNVKAIYKSTVIDILPYSFGRENLNK